MRKILAMSLLSSALVFTTGCKSMFVTDATRSQTPWQSFGAAQTAFDKIVPHQTTVEDLKGLGFDPQSTPNVKLLTYLDLIERFIPNASITKNDLQPDVRDCIDSKDGCHAYELNLEVVQSKRYGNLCLDVFGFKKKTRITGWSFKALVILKDDVVAYKLRSGQPNLERYEKKVKPLGPLQDLEGMVWRASGAL